MVQETYRGTRVPVTPPEQAAPVMPTTAPLSNSGRTVSDSAAASLSTTRIPVPKGFASASAADGNRAAVADERASISEQDFLKLVRDLIDGKSTPNPLNEFWQVAYHWRLFMMNDVDVFTKTGKPQKLTELYAAMDKLPQITIAETGVTTYNIKSVETRATVGPNHETRNAGIYKFTMQIFEPLGVGFLDVLKESALTMRIRNLQKCPYYIELSFRGYDEQDGNIQLDPLKNSKLEASRWIWQVQIIDIDTHFDATGGQYTLSLQVYNDGALEQDILTVPQNMNMRGSTIEGILKSLSTNMSASWKQRYGTDLVTYDFIMHKITYPTPAIGSNTNPNTYAMQSRYPDLSPSRIAPMQTTTAGEIGAQLAPGTSYTDIIEWILANNEKTQDLGLDRDSRTGQTDSSAQQTNSRNFKESIIFRVETDIEVKGYDIITANYYKIVHIHIWPYYTQALLTGPIQRDDAREPAVQAEMVKRLLERGFLRKHYDYLYTGLNTEVLGFDVRSSFKWNALLPKLAGGRASIDNTELAAKTNADLNTTGGNVALIPARIAERQAEIARFVRARDALGVELEELQVKLNQYAPAVAAAKDVLARRDPSLRGNRDIPTAEQIKDAEATIAKNEPLLNDTQKKIIINTDTTSDISGRVRTHGENTEIDRSTLRGNVVNPKYSEDLLKPDGTLSSNASDFQYEFFNYSISFRQGYREAQMQAGTGFTGQYHRDKSVFGSLIDQLYQPYTLQLANVDLEVRGDPYWLGASNLQRQVLLRVDGSDEGGKQAISNNLPNFSAGDQTFLVTFRFPVTTDDDGKPIFKANDTFNGIYRATEITSTFSDGVFKQKIHGQIVPLINVAAAFGNIRRIHPTDAGAGGAAAAGSGTANAAATATSAGPTGAPSPVRASITRPEQQANAERFKTALIAEGQRQGRPITEAQADGIVANAYRESSMNPTNSHDDGGKTSAGLLQWRAERRDAFQSYAGVTPDKATIEQQAAFTVRELATTEKIAYQNLTQATTAGAAADAWVVHYERPKDPTGGQSVNRSFIPNLYAKK